MSETLTIDVSTAQLTDDQFYHLCRQNEALRFEMTAKGELIVMPAVGGITGNQESVLCAMVWNWNEATGLGVTFSSSTIFRLPNGAKRSPDVAWVERSRWDALTTEEQEQFPPITPDFVIELRSRSDNLQTLRDKMQEYIGNGARLGWLINPQDQQVEIYEPGQPVVTIALPAELSGGAVLPGFTLALPSF